MTTQSHNDGHFPDFMNLTRELCALPTTGIVADGNEIFFRRVHEELPLRIFKYPSGAEYNGWIIPPNWHLKKAEIRLNGELVFDGTHNPLATAHHSKSVKTALHLDELKQHLFCSPIVPEAHMWHCSWIYRPWQTDWGFCPPKNWVDSLEEGLYEVEIVSAFEPGEMLVADCHIQGERAETIIFNSNNCHPHFANDGFAGTAVMIRLFQWLQKRNNLFSYRFVICPEHMGSVHYLANLDEDERNRFVAGVFGEMMGTDDPFTLGASFTGNHYIDLVFRHIVNRHTQSAKYTPFRQNAGNDETVWEAPGYEVPTVQTVRCHKVGQPYREYHSELDTPDLMIPEKLAEFYKVYQLVVEVLETNATVKRNFTGLVALSNPKYDLYFYRIDPAIHDGSRNNETERWGYFQDCVFRYLEGEMSILEMAERHQLCFFEVRDYLKKWEKKGLVSFNSYLFDKNTTLHVEQAPFNVP